MLDAAIGLLVDVVLTGIFYWPGKLILRIATLGHYPPHKDKPHNVIFVAGIGLGSFVALLTFTLS